VFQFIIILSVNIPSDADTPVGKFSGGNWAINPVSCELKSLSLKLLTAFTLYVIISPYVTPTSS
jgi:hypothetical protein